MWAPATTATIGRPRGPPLLRKFLAGVGDRHRRPSAFGEYPAYRGRGRSDPEDEVASSKCARPDRQWSSRANQFMNAVNSLGWARKYVIAAIGARIISQSCMGAPLQSPSAIMRSTQWCSSLNSSKNPALVNHQVSTSLRIQSYLCRFDTHGNADGSGVRCGGAGASAEGLVLP